MKVTYQFNEQELYDFNRYRLTRKNSNVIPRAVLVSCAYLAAILIIAYFTKFQLYMYFIFIPIAVLIFGFTLFFTWFKMRQSVRTLLRRANKEALMPETTLEITGEFLHVKTENRESEVLYRTVERIDYGKQFIYILLQDHGEIGVPIRAFENPQAARDFAKSIQEKAPKAVHYGV